MSVKDIFSPNGGIFFNNELIVIFKVVFIGVIIYIEPILSYFLVYTVNSILESFINKGLYYRFSIVILFTSVFLLNVIGLIPYSYSLTSQIFITIFLSFSILIYSWFIGFYNFNLEFFSILIPSGSPIILSWFLFLIELVSNLSRIISLGLRLAANIISGHLMIKVISSFVTYSFFVFDFIIWCVLVVKYCLELFVSFIQSYVFVLLSSLYLEEGIHLH